jgi:hypothetical protein
MFYEQTIENWKILDFEEGKLDKTDCDLSESGVTIDDSTIHSQSAWPANHRRTVSQQSNIRPLHLSILRRNYRRIRESRGSSAATGSMIFSPMSAGVSHSNNMSLDFGNIHMVASVRSNPSIDFAAN